MTHFEEQLRTAFWFFAVCIVLAWVMHVTGGPTPDDWIDYINNG